MPESRPPASMRSALSVPPARRSRPWTRALCALAVWSLPSPLALAGSAASVHRVFGAFRDGPAALAASTASAVLLGLLYLHQRISRRRAETALRGTIKRQSDLLEEISATSRLTELLQVCHSLAEANRVIRSALPTLFRNAAGGFYMARGPEGALELQVSWGALSPMRTFAPEDCWGLRRGRPRLFEPGRSSIVCRHSGTDAVPSLCVPLIADGHAFALLHVQSASSQPLPAEVQRLAGSLAEQLSLVIGNLRLQETLRSGSERDPLTDLYNRRHLEISLQRELARAQRHAYGVSLLILDVDHFKDFNDSNGHEAGDAVLREVAHVLKRHTRAEDIACRYGGDEFLLVLPSCTLDDAYAKAEAIREAIAQLRVFTHGNALPRITASVGLAGHPHDGERVEDLVSCADGALYRAKESGRNRIVANSPPGDVVLFDPRSRSVG